MVLGNDCFLTHYYITSEPRRPQPESLWRDSEKCER